MSLRQRTLTAVLLVPAVIAGLIWLPSAALAVVLGAFAVLAAWEWAALAGWRAPAARLVYGAVMGALLVAVAHFARSDPHQRTLLGLAFLWWLLALAVVYAYQRGWAFPFGSRVAGSLVGCLVIVPTWVAIMQLRDERGAGAVIVLLGLIWVADSAAYFTGRRWGRRKLAPRVSPGKTWEGVAGALVLSAFYGLGCGGALGLTLVGSLGFLLLCLLTVLFSILGDLVESLFKRVAGVKDSGDLLPGHGGILDRIDSLTAAAPVFALGLAAFGVHP